jgi:cytochrome c5
MKILKIVSVVLASVSLQLAASDMSEDAIKARIQPVGTVNVAGAQPEAATAARSGADVYAQACAACHAAGVLNAPKPGVAEDWAPRMEKGLEKVIQNAMAGFGAMPARGACMNCSDEEFAAAVEHMIEGI